MEFKEMIEKVETSATYVDWKAENPEYYLVHLFMMSGQPSQVGYYENKEDKVVSFVLTEGSDDITMNPPEECFKKTDSIPALETDDVKIDIPEAKKIVLELKEKDYSAEVVDKDMLILQMLEGNPIYNITLITKAFNFINVKVNALSGEVIEHKKSSILDLKKDDSASC